MWCVEPLVIIVSYHYTCYIYHYECPLVTITQIPLAALDLGTCIIKFTGAGCVRELLGIEV